jgi:hypothetical protein
MGFNKSVEEVRYKQFERVDDIHKKSLPNGIQQAFKQYY